MFETAAGDQRLREAFPNLCTRRCTALQLEPFRRLDGRRWLLYIKRCCALRRQVAQEVVRGGHPPPAQNVVARYRGNALTLDAGMTPGPDRHQTLNRPPPTVDTKRWAGGGPDPRTKRCVAFQVEDPGGAGAMPGPDRHQTLDRPRAAWDHETLCELSGGGLPYAGGRQARIPIILSLEWVWPAK